MMILKDEHYATRRSALSSLDLRPQLVEDRTMRLHRSTSGALRRR